jgi:hypothetical protein
MTAAELKSYFNKEYGIQRPWPETYKVDAETYANCCQAVFNWHIEHKNIARLGNEKRLFYKLTEFAIGIHGGLLFKNVELILKPLDKINDVAG